MHVACLIIGIRCILHAAKAGHYRLLQPSIYLGTAFGVMQILRELCEQQGWLQEDGAVVLQNTAVMLTGVKD